MRALHVSTVSLLAVFATALIAVPANAQTKLSNTLAKGTKWTARINDRTATMEMIGGRVRRSEEAHALKYEVDWGGADGTLHAVSDFDGTVREVVLNLNADGVKVQCRGALTHAGAAMMAGTCGESDAPTPWYAVRLEPGPKTAKVVVGQVVQLPEMNTVRLREASGASKGTEPPSISSIRQQLTGYYEAGGKYDSVIKLTFPNPPGGSDLAKWLSAHKSGLLSALEMLYLKDEITQFKAAERSTCGEMLSCQLAFRQQALLAALAGMRGD